ncbi:MAG: universal stress protein, partial [Mesorhizobium sp.]
MTPFVASTHSVHWREGRLNLAATEANLMNHIASLSLTTYPDPTPPKIAANAVAVVKQIGAALHAVAITVDIPDVSNALSSYLLDLPN